MNIRTSLLVGTFLLATTGSVRGVDIDGFTAGSFLGVQPQSNVDIGASDQGFPRRLDAIGNGNLTVEINQGTATGAYSHSQDTGVTGASGITYTLGGLPLASDSNAFRVQLVNIDLNGLLRITVDGVAFALSTTDILLDNGFVLPSFADFLFSDFPGVDFSNVSSVELQVDGTGTPALDVTIDAFATVCSTLGASGGSGIDPSGNISTGPCVAIDVEKATNGIDADDPNAGDAPTIAPGALVSWTYVVTNQGFELLQDVTVVDDQGVAVTCPKTTLASGESMICTGSALAENLVSTGATTVPGLCAGTPTPDMYENIATATGQSALGAVVQDTDPSHYCNPLTPTIQVEKATNGIDADDPNAGDAPQVLPGDLVNWTYEVTNTGNVALQNVSVTDDQGIAVSCPKTVLIPGESMICTGAGLAVDLMTTGFTTVNGLCGARPTADMYENIATASGDTAGGVNVQDTDPSHYCNPSAMLGDFVWLDANVNGIQDGGEPGVPGVTATLTGGGADGIINGVGDTTAVEVTDANGLYKFNGLIPGVEYKVTFSNLPAGGVFTLRNQGGDDTVDSDADPANGMTQVVVLAPGEFNDTLDAGIFVPAMLGDFVWLDANVNGIQDGGEPGVPGVTATLTGGGADGIINGVGDTTAVEVTDANGLYKFNGLIPGVEYKVTFSNLPAGGVFTLQNQGGDDTVDSDADPANGMTQVVVLAPGEFNDTLDAGIFVPAMLGDFVWLDANVNGIQDGGEPGVPGVTATLTGGGADGIINGVGDTTAVEVTDANGLYKFNGLIPGVEYKVTFSNLPPDGVFTLQNQGGDDTVDSDADPATGMTQVVVLASGEFNDTLDAGIFAPAMLGDFVWLDANVNGIQDGGEPGVPGVTATLTGGGADGIINGVGDTTAVEVTDANGLYKFNGLIPGVEYKVTFSNLPAGGVFTLQNQGGDDTVDSDADPANGMTQVVVLAPGEFNDTLDAGIFMPTPAIDVEKSTNGVDADDPNAGDAPQIDPGNAVAWSYQVTNTGNVALQNVTVTDDQGVAVTCPKSILAPGEVMTCTGNALAQDLATTAFTTVPGLCGTDPTPDMYENIATTSGQSGGGVVVQDTDPSHYCNPTGPVIPPPPGVCVPHDRQVTLTHNQTKVVNAANFFSLDPATCPIAYVVAWAKDEALGEKTPIKWNHLSGSTYTRRAAGQPLPNAVAAAQAIAVIGDPQDLVAQGAAIVGAQGGAFPDVPFDGTAYAELPNRLFTDFFATTGPRGSRLTLLTPDINVPTQNRMTQVGLNWWNEAEDSFSDSLEYHCLVRTRLEDVSAAFNVGGLGSFTGNLSVTPLRAPGILGVIEELEPNRWTMRNMFHNDPGVPGGVINNGGRQSGSAVIFPLLDINQTPVIRITNNHPTDTVQVHLEAICGEDR